MTAWASGVGMVRRQRVTFVRPDSLTALVGLAGRWISRRARGGAPASRWTCANKQLAQVPYCILSLSVRMCWRELVYERFSQHHPNVIPDSCPAPLLSAIGCAGAPPFRLVEEETDEITRNPWAPHRQLGKELAVC